MKLIRLIPLLCLVFLLFYLVFHYVIKDKSEPSQTQIAQQLQAHPTTPQLPPQQVIQQTESSPPSYRPVDSLNHYIDAPLVTIGQLAAMYARKGNIVVCHDLLNDNRAVSVRLNYDNTFQIAEILRSYGYTEYNSTGLTYWCNSFDPIGSFYDVYFHSYVKNSIFVRIRSKDFKTDLIVDLAHLASKHNLNLSFESCAFILKNRDGGYARRIYVPDCVSSMMSTSSKNLPPSKSNSVTNAEGFKD